MIIKSELEFDIKNSSSEFDEFFGAPSGIREEQSDGIVSLQTREIKKHFPLSDEC